MIKRAMKDRTARTFLLVWSITTAALCLLGLAAALSSGLQ